MDWDYLAGFFDGEGNLHINYIKNKTYQLFIRIYSSDERILKEIQNFLKYGKIYEKMKTGVFELVISKKEYCRQVLESIKDKVILKRNQIAFLLDNFEFNKSNNLRFDLDKFRGFITRKNVVRKNHTLI